MLILLLLVIEDGFEVSDDIQSCTKETIRKISQIDSEINVIDSPGLQERVWQNNYDQMVKIIKEMKYLHLIVIVIYFWNPRLTSSIQYMVKFLCNVFPINFLNHVAIVFTHYDHEYEIKRNKKKTNTQEKMQRQRTSEIVN